MTIDDVLYSFNRGAFHEKSQMKSIFAMMYDVKKLDDYTFQFRTGRFDAKKALQGMTDADLKSFDARAKYYSPVSFGSQLNQLTWLGASILDQETMKKAESEGTLKDYGITWAIGTGPYKFESWKQGDSVTLVKNKDYFDKNIKANADKIVFKTIKDPSALKTAFLNKEVDLIMNDSAKLRFAILYSINPSDIVNSPDIMDKRGIVTLQYVESLPFGHIDDPKGTRLEEGNKETGYYNPQKAKQLFDSLPASFKQPGSLKCTALSGSVHVKEALVVKDQVKKALGVDLITIEQVALSELATRRRESDPKVWDLLVNWTQTDDSYYIFVAFDGFNTSLLHDTKYYSKDAQEWIAKGNSLPNGPERHVAYQNAQKAILKAIPRVPLVAIMGDSFDYKGLFALDLGRSYVSNRPVFGTILERFPNTVLLSTVALLLSILVSIPFGILSATRQYSKTDMVVTVVALVGISMPAFWLGMLLIWIFSVQLRLFPSLAVPSNPLSIVLPAITLAAMSTAVQTRMTRSSMLEVMRQDYIRTARAKGLDEKVVIRKHALRNALIPVVTVVGIQVGQLLVGAVLTETVFSYPGIGTIMVDAINRKDTPQILASVVFMALIFAVVNLIVDILYAFIDPRIKAQYLQAGKRKKKGLFHAIPRKTTH